MPSLMIYSRSRTEGQVPLG